jgi:Putative bacterial sensory transduction regulator
VEAWLDELGLQPLGRAERDGVAAWDIVLRGRRAELRITVIFQPGLGLIVWLPYAAPLQDRHRRAYQQLLQWNDELPFVKFGLDAELRPVLSVEIAPEAAGRRTLGLALARVLAVCDHLAEAAPAWLRPTGTVPARERAASPGTALLDLYAAELAELTDAPATLVAGDRSAGADVSGSEEAGRS